MPIFINILARVVIWIFITGFTFLGFSKTPTNLAETNKPPINALTQIQGGAGILQEIQNNRSTNPVEKQIEQLNTEPQKQSASSTFQITQIQKPKKIDTNIFGINFPLPQIKTFSPEIFDSTFKNTASLAKETVVNIFCMNKEGKLVNVNTGSGIIINRKGVVLTNAHIGELFLLKNYPTKNFMDCSIRRGVSETYEASLLYLPDQWLEKNLKVIFSDNPVGNGERDYSLLLIVKDKNGAPLPENFSYTKPNQNISLQDIGENVFVAGYPGTILTNSYFEKYLSLAGEISSIKSINTFGENSLDQIQTEETTVGQRGSSGGAVLNKNGELIGLIDSVNGDTTKGSINAITLSHIEKDFKNEKGISLDDFLAKDLNVEVNKFASEKIPGMIKEIIAQ